MFFVWLQRETRELLRMDGRASCGSGLGTERLRPIDFLEACVKPVASVHPEPGSNSPL